MKNLLVSVIALASLCTWADTLPATCDQPGTVDKYQLLRRLSLDLRGRLPSYEEYTALDSLSDVPVTTITDWLASDDFRLVMRKYHEDLLLPNVSTVQLNNTNAQLTIKTIHGVPEPAYSLSSSARRAKFRGISDADTVHGLQCGDFETTHFLDGGVFRPDPAYFRVTDGGVGTPLIKQEGWRWVHPYWEPDAGTKVKVCSSDAQETLTAANGKPCNLYTTNGDGTCGCGPNLKFCYGPATIVGDKIRASMREQVNQLVDTVSQGAHPYTDLITTREVKVNGPLAFWKKYLAPNLNLSNVYAIADDTEPTPDRDFNDVNTWTTLDRGSDMHAGVLTTAGYLLRFQTNRSRANRYRIDFECEAFQPPATISTGGGCQTSGTDLTQRCTCQYCHQILEPMAAHWGQFSEAGTTLMSTTTFPRDNPNCINNMTGNARFCGRYYVTNSTDTNPGSLLAYQYANPSAAAGDVHKAIADNLAAGPRNLFVADVTNSNAFANCTVKRAYGYLMKREMRTAPPTPDEYTLMNTLAADFKNHNYSFPYLIQQIVSQPAYRSIR